MLQSRKKEKHKKILKVQKLTIEMTISQLIDLPIESKLESDQLGAKSWAKIKGLE